MVVNFATESHGDRSILDPESFLTSSQKLHVYCQDFNVREWLYVEDHIYGILAVMEIGKDEESTI